MIFSSMQYLIFFAVVLLFMTFARGKQLKRIFLLAASYFFYGFWDYRFLALMFIMSLGNYIFGKLIAGRATVPGRRSSSAGGDASPPNTGSKEIHNLSLYFNPKRWLIVSIVFNLTLLGFFKYFNFFIDSANALLLPFGARLGTLSIILPVGISFITFEVMSYTIDIYRANAARRGLALPLSTQRFMRETGGRGSVEPQVTAKSFLDLALLVAFFPHLIAGPILKPREFLPQFDRDITVKRANLSYGMQIFVLGLLKKVVVADNLAQFVDPVFKQPALYNTATIWLGVIAYAIQIYCDFSGYSDMAIGSARCMGFNIPRNFNVPYISRNITEFWRRWHISLSTWLREYLYFSLGGNRLGKRRQYLNLFIVMLLGGLWHGASWNFVVWGGLHGLGLAVHKIWSGKTGTGMNFPQENLYLSPLFRGFQLSTLKSQIIAFLSWLLTMLFVCVAWVFFRASDFTVSTTMLRKMLFLDSPEGIAWYAVALLLILPPFIAAHYLGSRLPDYPRLRLTTYAGLTIFFVILLGIVYLSPNHSSPFIYFQF